MGVLGGNDEDLGLLPRAVRQIFESIVNDSSGAEFAVSCSYLEIYKEAVRDLLQPAREVTNMGMPIREAVGKGVYVEGLTEVPVMGEGDVLDCVSCGNAARMVGSTLMNAQSSRSHALLMVNLQQKLPDGSTKVSRLNIADLAGSEKVAKTGSSGETLEEAKKINASLSALCQVISSLSEGKPHIPYRNSKLTRILQESLGGNSKTMMLVACSPSTNNAPETHSTLKFAARAKKVRNAAVVNRVLTSHQLESANAALRLELKSARDRLAAFEAGGGGGGSGGGGGASSGDCGGALATGACASDAAASAEELEALREQCEALEQQLEESKLEMADEQRECSGLKADVATHKEEREMLYDTLARFQLLQGVTPSTAESRKRDGTRGTLDALRRQLVDLEALALQKEMGTFDEAEENGAAAVDRLKSQLAEQHRRIRELEPLAELAGEARAAQQEVALLKEQLQQLAQQKLASMVTSKLPAASNAPASGGGASARMANALSSEAKEAFRAKEAFGQHMLRASGSTPTKESRPATDASASSLAVAGGIFDGVDISDEAAAVGGTPNRRLSTPSRIATEAATAAAARAVELDKELQLERSRALLLERKLSTAQAELATAHCGGPEAQAAQEALLSRVSSTQTEAELARGVLQRTYAAALQEVEADASRLTRAATQERDSSHVAVRSMAAELRRLEGEQQAAAAHARAEANVEATSKLAQHLRHARPASSECMVWHDAIESPASNAFSPAASEASSAAEEEGATSEAVTVTPPADAPPPPDGAPPADLPVALAAGLAGGFISSSKRERGRSKRSTLGGARQSHYPDAIGAEGGLNALPEVAEEEGAPAAHDAAAAAPSSCSAIGEVAAAAADDTAAPPPPPPPPEDAPPPPPPPPPSSSALRGAPRGTAAWRLNGKAGGAPALGSARPSTAAGGAPRPSAAIGAPPRPSKIGGVAGGERKDENHNSLQPSGIGRPKASSKQPLTHGLTSR